MELGRQSMYDTFGDKRALFLKALEVYVSENVRAINVEIQAPGSPLAAIRRALVHFSERKDLSSTDGCMGMNAICEFDQRDADVTRIIQKAGRTQRQTSGRRQGIPARALPTRVQRHVHGCVRLARDPVSPHSPSV